MENYLSSFKADDEEVDMQRRHYYDEYDQKVEIPAKKGSYYLGRFFMQEIQGLLAMALMKCQEARNLVRKTPSITVDGDQKIKRVDGYLDRDGQDLGTLIDIYNECDIRTRHHEIL